MTRRRAAAPALPKADALVFFGATGDLAAKQIFPALQAMVAAGDLKVPVIGVAKAGWTLDQLKERARDSVTEHGGLDEVAFPRLLELLRYVDGDYADIATFVELRKQLGRARRPLHYLAIPPALFALVIRQLADSGCADVGRVVIEKPFGHDGASSTALNAEVTAVFPEEAIFRIDHFLGKEAVENLFYFRFANSFTEPFWNREHVESIQITMAESFGVQGRGAFYDANGAIRDVVQNHLLRLVGLLCMEPPAVYNPTALHREQLKVLEGLQTLKPADVVRGQFRGYRKEPGVRRTSTVETFAAVRLELDTWRWAGVPVFIRAGKCLPVTATEILVDLKPPPQHVVAEILRRHSNYVKFRIGSEMAISIGARVYDPDRLLGEDVELYAQRKKTKELPPYQRLLTDALHGSKMLFGGQDAVDQLWRIVDPILDDATPVHPYAPGTWGPAQADRMIAHYGGWHQPSAEVGAP